MNFQSRMFGLFGLFTFYTDDVHTEGCSECCQGRVCTAERSCNDANGEKYQNEYFNYYFKQEGDFYT